MLWHVDCAHGWLQVEWQAILDLGIADKISKYSYMAGLFAYLEEDCDANIYLEASGKSASDFAIREYEGEAFLRNYPRFDIDKSIYAQILLQMK